MLMQAKIMRVIIMLLSVIILNSQVLAANLEYSSENISNSNKVEMLMQALSNESVRVLFFNKTISTEAVHSLNLFLRSIPPELLDILLTDNTDTLEDLQQYSDEHFFISKKNDDASSHRKILHYLMHQYDSRHQISRSKRWRKLSGWKRAWYGLKMKANNSDNRAYAEPYGQSNPAEDFVTIAEHFILPPTSTLERAIKCRTPLKYAFVKELFPNYDSPLDKEYVVCQDKAEGILNDVIFTNPDTGKIINLGPVNEETVTGFELLYATPGTGDASEIAGHLLLRIKLNNNPQAELLGIENPNDLVISFLADTTDNQQPQASKLPSVQAECTKSWINSGQPSQSNFEALRSILQSLKGLSGGFLTLMDRQPLSQAIKNYTIEEDRDILRYKLDLDKKQTHLLLEQLYRAKKNYNAQYYFFNQNCASVLVKVIGIGIQSKKIAEFNPIVSPPNSLVALFIREGLAKPVRPAFYSYRKKAFLAQDLIAHYYQKLKVDYSELSWPNIKPLFNKNNNGRLNVLKAIAENIGQHIDLDVRLNHLFVLVQEAEMAYEHKDLICQQYTSVVTSQARQYQQSLILASTPVTSSISTDELLSKQFIGSANDAFEEGVPHTKLLAYAIGGGYYSNSRKHSNAILSLNVTLDEQQLGSISNIAMQRSSYVKLASTQINLSNDIEQPNSIQSWRFTALDVRKFKDRLNQVPSFFSSAGSMGLGLSLLDFEKDNGLELEHGTLVGGELLFNLISSAEHNDYIYSAIGADLRYHKDINVSRNGVVIPTRVETLWTFDKKRRLQWRNKFEYRFATDNNFEGEYKLSTGLSYQMGELAGRLFLLRLSSEYNNLGGNENSQLTWLGIEINPY